MEQEYTYNGEYYAKGFVPVETFQDIDGVHHEVIARAEYLDGYMDLTAYKDNDQGRVLYALTSVMGPKRDLRKSSTTFYELDGALYGFQSVPFYSRARKNGKTKFADPK